MNERAVMKCDEFEVFGLDSQADPSLSEDRRRQVLDHARVCGRCAALRDSWKAAKTELSSLSEYTAGLGAPLRVEARLLQQFRVKHQFKQERRAIKFAVWSLAAAAVLFCMVSVWDWQKWRQGSFGKMETSTGSIVAGNTNQALTSSSVASGDSYEMLIAGNDDGDFTQLPGSSSQETEDAAIVRVGMQRASLSALGLPVDEERAGDWIQVDLLVASDGSPQAVRLPQ